MVYCLKLLDNWLMIGAVWWMHESDFFVVKSAMKVYDDRHLVQHYIIIKYL